MQEGVKSGVKVPPVELLDYDGGSHGMMGIPNTRGDLDLRGAHGRSGVPHASGTSDEFEYMDDGGGDIYFLIYTMMMPYLLALTRVITVPAQVAGCAECIPVSGLGPSGC